MLYRSVLAIFLMAIVMPSPAQAKNKAAMPHATTQNVHLPERLAEGQPALKQGFESVIQARQQLQNGQKEMALQLFQQAIAIFQQE
jgi:hypothetical protein